ncbi:MAG: SRPBCC domain-containing protein [Nocardioides sp.]
MDPIRHTVDVTATPEQAFEVFTVGMGTWWGADYSPDASTYTGIDLDPRPGGIVALRHGEASYPIGEVTVWEPGAHYAQTFSLAMDADHPSALDVHFAVVDAGCRVNLAHGGWSVDNSEHREKYGDWPVLLDRFRLAAEA